MTLCRHGFAVKGLIICGIALPAAWSAGSGCVNGQLQGTYNAQVSNINIQNVLQALRAPVAPATNSTTTTTAGFAGNDNSLSGNLPALGRYYFDGSGNIVGVAGKVAFNVAVGKYSVNTDCSGKATLASGASYDFVLSNEGQQVTYLRTDAAGGGNVGVLHRAASCVGLNYPSGFTFAVAGGSQQTGSTGATAFGPYSAIGALDLTGTGQFALTETLYNSSGVVRSTASGTYSVGADCSVSFKFSGAHSSNFVAPTSIRALMQDSSAGMLVLQPDANTTLTGTLTAQ